MYTGVVRVSAERKVQVLLNYTVGKNDWLSENVDRMETAGFTGEITSKDTDRKRGWAKTCSIIRIKCFREMNSCSISARHSTRDTEVAVLVSLCSSWLHWENVQMVQMAHTNTLETPLV